MTNTRLEPPRIDPELPPSSDPFGEVLHLLQLTGVLYCNAQLSDPWGIELPQLPGVMNVEVVTSGHCWIELAGKSPVYMPQGSLVLIPRGDRHILRGNPGDKATWLQDIPVERIGDRFENMQFGGGGRLTRITYYGVRFDPYLANRLVRLLPDMLHLRTHVNDGSWLQSTIQFIAQEAQARLPGSETVITRLADILVIQAIRTWIESVRDEERGWIAALHDPGIGKALSLMHRQPEHDWHVESLAHEIGMSRSGFSARFTAMVGESVKQYLTTLRMQLAHRELRETSDSLARIAERVGYQSEQAFNRAFKREVGVSPGAVRRHHART
ncbi:cupin domain-containing protein [Granulosicoccus sp. 3-233]|uniref:AraC family transcriptional regulator n=1 Tax=Granulosicoccus sp. 3-233 TaxID=3417969 RepID=UPI003D353D31